MVAFHKHTVSRFLEKEKPDVYGQTHPIENESLIFASLTLLDEELKKLPIEDALAYQQAIQKCPLLALSKKHKLMFLRCEQFRCDLAAQRLAKYWRKRTKTFGDDAFDETLSLEGALRNDRSALSIGFIRQLPGTDHMGRAIAYVQPRILDRSKYSKESMVRAVWYTMHAMLESIHVQQKGIVFIVDLKGSKMVHFDVKMVRACTASIKGVLPLRVSAIHFCQTPKLFDLVSGTVHLMLGELLRKRIINHGGLFKDEDDVEELEKYGIYRGVIPKYIGGNAELDQESWLKAREVTSKWKAETRSRSLGRGQWQHKKMLTPASFHSGV